MTGSIEVGKSADFVLLYRGIVNVNADEVEEAVVTMTILQGDVVFDKVSH